MSECPITRTRDEVDDWSIRDYANVVRMGRRSDRNGAEETLERHRFGSSRTEYGRMTRQRPIDVSLATVLVNIPHVIYG